MAVVVDSGVPEARDPLDQWPVAHWRRIAHLRRFYLKGTLSDDCRDLVRFVADAERMFAPLGYRDAEQFIREALDLDPTDVSIAVAWLRKNEPDAPIPYPTVLRLAEHGGARPGAGRPKKGEARKAENQGDVSTLNKRGSTSRPYILARLERDGHIALAAQIRAGEISAAAAARQAGIAPPKPTRVERVLKLIEQLTDEEREQVAAIVSRLRGPAP